MRRLALVLAVAGLLASTQLARGAETVPTSPDKDRLHIQPIPPPPPPGAAEEDKEPLEIIGGYFADRFRDLADIFTLKLGWGNYRSIGVQARLLYPVQIGAGFFEGWVFAMDRGMLGTMKEVEAEGGVSIFYVGYIARQVTWQTDDAKEANIFFGDVGDTKNLTVDDLKYYDDENANALSSTAQVQLPCLPKIELTINWGEIPDFLLSIVNIKGARVPPPFHKQDGPDGERIPAPSSIFWHGQEEAESFK